MNSFNTCENTFAPVYLWLNFLLLGGSDARIASS